MMAHNTTSREAIINALFDVGAFRFDGPFTLKSGITSPFYVDFRILVSKPDLLTQIASAIVNAVSGIQYDVLCGVPYTALPIATAISIQCGIPMVIRRKEGAKSYGTKKLIEGIIVEGQRCLIVEDLVTSGLSVFETIEPIQEHQMCVNDVVVILDREQGGRANIEKRGIRLHSVMTISHVLDTLLANGKISSQQCEQSRAFIKSNQVNIAESGVPTPSLSAVPAVPYESKAKASKNPKLRALFELMLKKQSNLCLSADLTNCVELVKLADQLGPYICMIKTHVDILDFTPEVLSDLQRLALQHQFMIWEDRKFADIGNTVLHQFTGGIYEIAKWADFVSVHSISGPGIIDALVKGSKESQGRCQGGFMLAEMSSEGNLMNESYTQATVSMCEKRHDFICGYIAQKCVSNDPGVVHIAPGVQLQAGGDALGQQYRTPDVVVCDKGADIIVVGRGIIAAENKIQKCIEYRDAGWKAYQKRIHL